VPLTVSSVNSISRMVIAESADTPNLCIPTTWPPKDPSVVAVPLYSNSAESSSARSDELRPNNSERIDPVRPSSVPMIGVQSRKRRFLRLFVQGIDDTNVPPFLAGPLLSACESSCLNHLLVLSELPFLMLACLLGKALCAGGKWTTSAAPILIFFSRLVKIAETTWQSRVEYTGVSFVGNEDPIV